MYHRNTRMSKKGARDKKNMFENMTENFLNLVKEKVTQVQKAQRVPNKMNPRNLYQDT